MNEERTKPCHYPRAPIVMTGKPGGFEVGDVARGPVLTHCGEVRPLVTTNK
jgi:hypothetical protein